MKFTELLKRFFKFTLDGKSMRCINCRQEIFSEEYLCADCQKEISLIIDGNYCAHCGRVTKAKETYCLTCKNFMVETDLCRSAFDYTKTAKLIKKLKYDGAKWLAEFFAKNMAKVYIKEELFADFITFVPMTEKKQKKRKFNQTELLANSISTIINLPVVTVIEKIKETPAQAGLKRKDRLENLTGAFKVIDKQAVLGKTVLLIDDVLTTGATAESVAKKLKKSGAKKVILLTACSAPDIYVKGE
ncbi:MAG: ComF family protein [Clostridia bacterium]|nr:ComF family protein [Clostridia bacterium]